MQINFLISANQIAKEIFSVKKKSTTSGPNCMVVLGSEGYIGGVGNMYSRLFQNMQKVNQYKCYTKKKKSKLSGPNCLGSGEEVDGELGNLRAECWFSLYKLNLES